MKFKSQEELKKMSRLFCCTGRTVPCELPFEHLEIVQTKLYNRKKC